MQKRNISVTLECYVKKDNKYLMLHRNPQKRILPNVWMAPGGHREMNEGLFECARREILEETGLKIKNLRIISTGCAYLEDLDLEVFFTFVVADYAGGKLIQNPADGELVWLTLKQILKLDNLLAELRCVLPKVLGANKKILSYKAVYKKGNEMTELIIEKP